VPSDRKKGGRVTPKKATAPPGRPRRSVLPSRVGPFEKPDASRPVGQVGRRPSSPAKLLVFSIVYVAAGILSFFTLKGSLAVIIGVVFIGMGLLWLRGAATAKLRQQQHSQDD
jgi:hypothetical protein